MGSRRQQRVGLRLPVIISGTQEDGTIFVEQVRTLDISPTGARLSGLVHPLTPGAILELRHGCASGRFRVAWVGTFGSDSEGQVGLSCVEVGASVVRTLLYISEQEYGLERNRRTLEGAGYKVLACRPAEAEGRIGQFAIDAAIIEHPLGACDLDGLTACLRQHNPRVPILLLSGQPGSLPEGALRRMDALLHKSVLARDLLVEIKALVGPGTQLKWPVTRSTQRYPVGGAVTVRLVRRGRARLFEGRTLDMSEDGAAVSVAADMLPGEVVFLSFKQEACDGDLCLYGTVRRRTAHEYGIEFFDLSAEQREAIRMVCEGLPPTSCPTT